MLPTSIIGFSQIKYDTEMKCCEEVRKSALSAHKAASAKSAESAKKNQQNP